jgi:hypothetical protein
LSGNAKTNAIAKPTPRLHQKSCVAEPGLHRSRHEQDEPVVDGLHHRDGGGVRREGEA